MKSASALGLVGLWSLLAACSSGNGNAVFTDIGGKTGVGAASPGGSSSGGKGADGSGGSNSDAGKGAVAAGGTSNNMGGTGTAGTDTNGGNTDAGDGPGPTSPEVIFVAPSGTDSADCGLVQATPCRSISIGVARSVEASRTDVYVQAGHYSEIVLLKPGVHVLGGFDTEWKSGVRTDGAHQVVIEGGKDEATKEYVAVWAHDLPTQAVLENLLIAAPAAQGQKEGTHNGRSSYGVHASAAKLSLKDVDITAGNGANATPGDAGQDAVALTATDAMSGKAGSPGESGNMCSPETSAGGPAGTNSCSDSPSSVDMTGGKGGNGGAKDTSCTNQGPQNFNFTAQAGGTGADASTVAGQQGKGGGGGSGAGQCGATTPGNPGVVSNGSGGKKAADGGKTVNGFWYALPGGTGSTGQNGGGGGGGGGSGGCDQGFPDARGTGGGGGAAGGCSARSGGGGGGGGGGSFGIFAVNSTIDIANVTVTRGTGGAGGDGGAGGQGQAGGVGINSTAHPGNTALPGKGGNGGHGGHGGGGAGGNGGSSLGALLVDGATLNGTLMTSGGAPGKAGEGGPSAPALGEGGGGIVGEDGNAGALAESAQL